MQLKLNSRIPVYVQVVRYFKEQIASGKIQAGEEMPSRRELANQLKINPNTVQRAYKEMEELGLIHTEGNLPSRVTRDENKVQEIRESLLEEAVQSFVTSIDSLNIPLEKAIPLIEKSYKGGNVDD